MTKIDEVNAAIEKRDAARARLREIVNLVKDLTIEMHDLERTAKGEQAVITTILGVNPEATVMGQGMSVTGKVKEGLMTREEARQATMALSPNPAGEKPFTFTGGSRDGRVLTLVDTTTWINLPIFGSDVAERYVRRGEEFVFDGVL